MSFDKDFTEFLGNLPHTADLPSHAREPSFKSPCVALEKQTVFGLNIFNWQHPTPQPSINRLYDWVYQPELPATDTELYNWLLGSSTVSDVTILRFRYFLWLIVDVLGEINILDKHLGLIINNERLLYQNKNISIGWNHDQWGIWTDVSLRVYKPKKSISPIKSLKTFRDNPVNLRDEWVHDLYNFCSQAFPLLKIRPDINQNFLSVLEVARVLYPSSRTSNKFWRR